MWAWRMMMMMMMMTLAVLVMIARGGTALPFGSTNDRPIIGILTQEIHGSLADVLTEILANDGPQFVGVNRERSNIFEKYEYNDETRPDYPERHLEDLEHLKNIDSHETAMESDAKTKSSISVSQEPEASSQSPSIVEGSTENPPLENPTSEAESLEPPTTKPPHPPFPKNASYIGASYVKFVEAAGARVVPIFVNRERAYYEQLLNSINGVLFPGGAVAIDETSGFGRAGKIIYEIARDLNDDGDVFPLWGTCLGFEMMMGLAANGQEIRVECDAQNIANHLKLDADYADGYLLRHLPKRLLKALTTKPITSNFHKYCVTPKNFSQFGVDKTYRALAYSADRRGVAYIAAAEAWDYPFFAVQFHPEKSPYEWTTKPGHNEIAHSSVAVDAANYFGKVYVNYARRNKHRFTNASVEANSLIYNYAPIYTGQYSFMEQIYLF